MLLPPEGAADVCLEPGVCWGDAELDRALAAWFTAFTVSKTRRQLLWAGSRGSVHGAHRIAAVRSSLPRPQVPHLLS